MFFVANICYRFFPLFLCEIFWRAHQIKNRERITAPGLLASNYYSQLTAFNQKLEAEAQTSAKFVRIGIIITF